MDATAILLNYERPKELADLVENLKGQSLRPRIILADNARTPHPYAGKVDKYLHIPWNAACFIRLHLSHYVDTEYVVFIDDDKLPRDSSFVEDGLRVAREHPGVVMGGIGKLLSTVPPHHYEKDAFGLVHVIKGYMVFFERRLLEQVPMTYPFKEEKKLMDRCDDIHLSMMIGKGMPVHWAEKSLHDRLINLDCYGVGLSHDPAHNDLRDRAAKHYLNHFGAGIP